ncbi:MAG: peptide synthetase, partial [Mucilaginibacter sp.]|nr:peptide synthetase [Mucilaginibacter sp.]
MNELSIVIGADRPDLIREETLVDLFSESARKYENKTALIFHDRQLTYGELDRWSDAVAAYLIKNGIGRKSNVGVWWQRGFELHVAILGIIKAGAAYVPVDREIPAERVEVILTEVGAAACFSMQQLNVKCKMLQVPSPPNSSTEGRALLKVSPLGGDLEGADCAYVLYTSGSTGKPKGIPISHKQICHLIRAEQTIFNINAD